MSIALTSAARSRAVERLEQPLLGGAEALHRDDRRRLASVLLSRGSRANSSTRSAELAPALGALHQGGAGEHREPRRGRIGIVGVDHHRLDHARVRARPRRRPSSGLPIAAMNFSVGPLTARPATSGLTAITGAPERGDRLPHARARRGSARSRSPGSRGRPRSHRRCASASSTSGVGAALVEALNLDPLDRRLDAIDDQELLQPAPAARRSGPACRPARSHIGSTAARTPSARAICPWAAVSVPPSAMKWVR